MIRRTLELIGLTVLVGLILYQYLPGVASRLGLPASGMTCPGFYIQVEPNKDTWVACENQDLYYRLTDMGRATAAQSLTLPYVKIAATAK